MESNDKKKDIFMEAARMALEKQTTIPAKIENSIEESILPAEKTQQELALEAVTTSDWEKLKTALNGRYAKKFMDLLETLPDREFMRLYPKMLEYVQPKVVRQEVRPLGEEQKTINIRILQVDETGNKRIIDITSDENNED
jgi:hypothetical protein